MVPQSQQPTPFATLEILLCEARRIADDLALGLSAIRIEEALDAARRSSKPQNDWLAQPKSADTVN